MTKQKIFTTTPNQQILWSMVYLNTIPIRNLSHKTEKNVWGAIVRGLLFGGQLSGGLMSCSPHQRLLAKTETCCHNRLIVTS